MKHNISTPTLEAPKIVGFIKLPSDKRKIVVPAEFKFYLHFPIKDFNQILEIVKKINKKIGQNSINNLNGPSITISKLARINGELAPDFGSIWYSCGNKEFMEFRRAYSLFKEEKIHSLRKITKIDFCKMLNNHYFTIIYVANDNSYIDVVPCLKLNTNKTNTYISYEEQKIVNSIKTIEGPYKLFLEDIDSNGNFISFNADDKEEIGYLYVSNLIENL